MDINNYIQTLTSETKKFLNKTEEFKSKFPEFFDNSITKEDLSSLSEDKMKIFFQISQVINDTQISFNKIASLNYFAKKLDIEINPEIFSEVKGLTEFISVFEPFMTDYIINEEDELEVINKETNDLKFENFQKNIKNIVNIL